MSIVGARVGQHVWASSGPRDNIKVGAGVVGSGVVGGVAWWVDRLPSSSVEDTHVLDIDEEPDNSVEEGTIMQSYEYDDEDDDNSLDLFSAEEYTQNAIIIDEDMSFQEAKDMHIHE